MDDPGPLCMACAEMDHLVFLPSGDAALTRRARRGSGLSAVVVRFSRARGRYERQGILVEEAALEQAEAECLADEPARARRREREPAEERARTSSSKPRWQPRSPACIPDAPTERARRSPGTPRPVAADASDDPPPDAHSTTGARAGRHRVSPPPGHPLRRTADVRHRPKRSARTGTRHRQQHPGRLANKLTREAGGRGRTGPTSASVLLFDRSHGEARRPGADPTML